MKRHLLQFSALIVLCVSIAFAAQKEPKDAIHLIGAVSKISGDTVTVEAGGGNADVVLLPTTTYKVGVKPGTSADLQPGDTVNAVVVRANKRWEAQSVKITHPKKK